MVTATPFFIHKTIACLYQTARWKGAEQEQNSLSSACKTVLVIVCH